jgi:CBS domain containing-hemolysin-like protein
MVPRIDVVSLEIDTKLDEARQVIIKAGHSRIPVYEESLDHVRGLLYAKDLLEVWHRGDQEINLQDLLREAHFVPESKRVSDLLHELQNKKVHMAVVIDEYGGTAGLVTIEDIVEEIFGEIFDEYDEATEEPYTQISDNQYFFDARIDLDDFNRLLDTELPDELGDTLGGYIYGKLGKVPETGETIEANRLSIEVLEVMDRRIRKVRVTVHPRELVTSETQETESEEYTRKNGNSR